MEGAENRGTVVSTVFIIVRRLASKFALASQSQPTKWAVWVAFAVRLARLLLPDPNIQCFPREAYCPRSILRI